MAKRWFFSLTFALLSAVMLAPLLLGGCWNGGARPEAVKEPEVVQEEGSQESAMEFSIEPPPAEEPVTETVPPAAEPPVQRNAAPPSEPVLVRVPGVSGVPYGDASAMLAGQGLRVGASEDYSESVPAGCVISQEPPAGSSVSPGSTVIVLISLGPAWTTCPSCNGASSASTEYPCPDCGGTGWCYT